MRVVFMGTPEFAVPSLRKLAAAHEVVGVFCQPDRPKGRGNKLAACPVKEAALALNIPVHQPKRMRARKWVALLRELAPDVAVVAAFGQILSQTVLDVPRLGCVNVHASLLPRWRGASPIHHALMARDAEAGVGIMRMVAALDAGPVYAQAGIPVPPDMGRMALEERLADLGADLLVETLPQLETRTPVPQDEALVTWAPIIEKDLGHVDPATQDAETVYAMVRALEGWPAVYCGFRDIKLKLAAVRPCTLPEPAPAGSLAHVTKKRLVLACADGTALDLLEVQVPGKKVMPAAAFINGYQPRVGETLHHLA